MVPTCVALFACQQPVGKWQFCSFEHWEFVFSLHTRNLSASICEKVGKKTGQNIFFQKTIGFPWCLTYVHMVASIVLRPNTRWEIVVQKWQY